MTRVPAPALVEMLQAAGVELHAPDRGRLIVRPAGKITPGLAEAVRSWKPELCRLLDGRRAAALDLRACPGCQCEFVLGDGACRWCEQAVHAGRFTIAAAARRPSPGGLAGTPLLPRTPAGAPHPDRTLTGAR